jgi:hypothetical protein
MNPAGVELSSGIKAGTKLLPVLVVQNPADPNAVAIRPVDLTALIEYVPSFYAEDARKLLSQAALAASAQLTVLRLNEDAPLQLRLLCKLECPVPQGFRLSTPTIINLCWSRPRSSQVTAIIDSSLRGGEADEAIQSPRRGLWIASLRSQ